MYHVDGLNKKLAPDCFEIRYTKRELGFAAVKCFYFDQKNII